MSRAKFLEGLVRVRRQEVSELERQLEERRSEGDRLMEALGEIDRSLTATGGALAEESLDPWLLQLQSNRVRHLLDRKVVVREALEEESRRMELVRDRLNRGRMKLEILETERAECQRAVQQREETLMNWEAIEAHVAMRALRA